MTKVGMSPSFVISSSSKVRPWADEKTSVSHVAAMTSANRDRTQKPRPVTKWTGSSSRRRSYVGYGSCQSSGSSGSYERVTELSIGSLFFSGLSKTAHGTRRALGNRIGMQSGREDLDAIDESRPRAREVRTG